MLDHCTASAPPEESYDHIPHPRQESAVREYSETLIPLDQAAQELANEVEMRIRELIAFPSMMREAGIAAIKIDLRDSVIAILEKRLGLPSLPPDGAPKGSSK